MDYFQIGTTPISDDAPAGQDVRYEPNFEALSEEVAKMGNPSAASAINWAHVVALCAGILEKESKHLQVASYLCYGLLKTQGLDGFDKGLGAFRAVAENFWDSLYPPAKRMKGRRAIVVWWEEKVSQALETADKVTWEKENRDRLLENLDFLDCFFEEKLPDAPMLRPMINQVKSLVMEKSLDPPPQEIQSPPENERTGEAVTQVASAPAQDALVPVQGDARVLLKQGLGLVASAAGQIQQEDAFDPLPYRLNRICLWTPLKSLPVATGGKTMLPPPDDQVLASIDTLYTAGNWQVLAESCESRVGQFLFWLDLSRYVAEGMEQLGHACVGEVIQVETAMFSKRLTGIDTLCFSDGTPFADPQTREWLAQNPASGTGDKTPAVDTVDGKIRESVILAQGLVKEKKIDAGLGLLMESLGTAASEREKFLWKIAVCRLLINARQIQIASSYVDDLLAAIDTHHLEKWEPDHAVEGLSLALTALRLLKDSRHEERIRSVIQRISVLDPISALKLV